MASEGQQAFNEMREQSRHTKDGLIADKMRYRKALLLACDGDKGKAMEFLRAADGMGPSAGARPLSEWHEDDGPVTWWKFPVDEPAWIGTPNSSDWPGYHTHWTPHPPMPLGVQTGEGGEHD